MIHLSPHLGVVTYPPGATFGPRRLTDFEFVWILAGDVVYTVNGQPHPAPAECIVLCTPSVTDAFRWDPNHPTRHAYFHFTLTTRPPGLPPPAHWPIVRPCADGDILRPLFRHILATAGQPPAPQAAADRAAIHAAVTAMLYAFVLGRDLTAPVLQPAPPPPVERALAYIHARLDADPAAPIPLHTIAAAAGVTPEHLCRLFRKHTTRGPAQTVRLARLDHAVTLLARSNYAVAEVAHLCGFASPFHFSRAFKTAYAVSPTQLRQRLAAGETPPITRLLTR